MKFSGSVLLFWILVICNSQNLESQLLKIRSLANESPEKAESLLNKIDLSSYNNDEKSHIYWYKFLLSNNKDSVLHYCSYYSLPGISDKNKSLLLMANSSNYLNYNWLPNIAFQYAKEAYEIYQSQPQSYDPFEQLYIINEYAFSLFSLGKYNEATKLINPFSSSILEEPCGYFSYLSLNNLVLMNVVSNRPDIGANCGAKILNCNPPPNPLLSSIYNNLGQLNIYNGNYYQALIFQEKAKNNYNELQEEIAYEWYWHMGWLNSDLGNFQLADSYYDQSEKMIVSVDGIESYDYFIINMEKLKNNIRKKDSIRALTIINKLEYLQQQVGIENDIATDFLELKGDYYNLKKNYTSAIANYSKALQNRKELAGDQNFLILSSYKKLIESCIKNQQFDQAKNYIEQAEAIIQKNFSHSSTHDILQIHLYKNQFSSLSTEENISFFENLLQQSSNNYEWRQESFYHLAQLYFTEATQNPNDQKWIKKATQNIDSSYHYAQKLQLFQSHLKNKWNSSPNNLRKIRKLGIQISLWAYEQNPNNASKERVFHFLDYTKYDRYKNHLLAVNQYPINDSISHHISEEKRIRSEINAHYSALEKGAHSPFIHESLKKLNKSYEFTLQNLSKNSKSYYDYFVKLPQISYKKLQKELSSEEVFISYTLVDEQLVTMVISPDKFYVSEVKNAMTPLLKSYHESMEKGDFNGFKESAYSLYRILLAPYWNDIQNKKLLISLDGSLTGLSLETLITNHNGADFQNLDYVLYDLTPQYIITGTSYILLKEIENKKGDNVSFIAPDFAKNDNHYIEQPFVKQWMEDFKDNPSNTIVSPSNHSKEEILQAFHNTPISIIGTHTTINEFNPLETKMILDPNDEEKNIKLFEIFNLQDTSDLIVLASCNTAQGKENEQMGMFSIANGFSYSGSKTIIGTLWKVDEQSTINILKNTWENDSNLTLNQKLKESKIKFIKNNHPKLANPYYWGGIVLFGSDYKSQSPESPTLWVLLFLLMTGILALIIYPAKKIQPIKNS